MVKLQAVKNGKMSRLNLLNFKPVAVYGVSNNTAVLVYTIDQYNDTVLAGYNGHTPELCNIDDCYNDDTQEIESGFYFGDMFIPFSECMLTSIY